MKWEEQPRDMRLSVIGTLMLERDEIALLVGLGHSEEFLVAFEAAIAKLKESLP